MQDDIQQKIIEFEKRQKNIAISYGGDGTLLDVFHKNPDKAIIPIRNYGQCEQHIGLIDSLLGGKKQLKTDLKMKTYDLLTSNGEDALSEIQIVSANPTSCLRMDVFINNNKFMENVIANGVIVSTVIGATGYFKSVARTIFRDGFGLGFICPTYGINNVVLKSTDWVNIVFKRDAKALMSWDNITKNIDIETGNLYTFSPSTNRVALLGYDIFMCPECRKGRNSTIINDQYSV